MVNGTIPFREVRSIELKRHFIYKEAKFDDEGNQIRSLVEETTIWNSNLLRAPGVSVAPLKFYLNKGKNTIRIQPQREALALGSITLQSPSQYSDYEEVKNAYPKTDYQSKQ